MQLYLSLPLSGSYVHIYFSGSRVLLQADAGSLVSYDWCHHIFSWCLRPTLVPSEACWELQDDFHGLNVSPMLNTEALALSWKALGSPASCSITGPNSLCRRDRESQYQSLDLLWAAECP